MLAYDDIALRERGESNTGSDLSADEEALLRTVLIAYREQRPMPTFEGYAPMPPGLLSDPTKPPPPPQMIIDGTFSEPAPPAKPVRRFVRRVKDESSG